MENIHANLVGNVKKDIYIIENDINNKVYVGQSKDVEKRFKNHCKKCGTELSNDILKYGKQHFWYRILEEKVSNYNEREIYWIKKYNCIKPNGYNIMEGGDKPPIYYGDDHRNAVISDELVEYLKEDLRDTNYSLSNLAYFYGISKRQVLRINQGLSRAKLGESYPIRKNPNPLGKLTDDDVLNIIDLLKHTYRFNGDIAREYGVEVHAIDRINKGITHRIEGESYPIRDWKSSGVILFTYEQVTEIIRLLKESNLSINKIAKKYNVSFTAICNINTGVSKKYRRKNIDYPIRPY